MQTHTQARGNIQTQRFDICGQNVMYSMNTDTSSKDEPLQTLRVLVTEDAPDVRRLIVSSLREIPYVDIVAEAESVSETLTALEQEHPDVAILDINLPDGTGIDILRRLKQEYPEVRGIILTNHANPFYERTCKKAGAKHFFDKSSDLAQVISVVTTWARQQAAS